MLTHLHSLTLAQLWSVSNQNRFAHGLKAYAREPFPMLVGFHVYSIAKYVHNHSYHVHNHSYHVHNYV